MCEVGFCGLVASWVVWCCGSVVARALWFFGCLWIWWWWGGFAIGCCGWGTRGWWCVAAGVGFVGSGAWVGGLLRCWFTAWWLCW